MLPSNDSSFLPISISIGRRVRNDTRPGVKTSSNFVGLNNLRPQEETEKPYIEFIGLNLTHNYVVMLIMNHFLQHLKWKWVHVLKVIYVLWTNQHTGRKYMCEVAILRRKANFRLKFVSKINKLPQENGKLIISSILWLVEHGFLSLILVPDYPVTCNIGLHEPPSCWKALSWICALKFCLSTPAVMNQHASGLPLVVLVPLIMTVCDCPMYLQWLISTDNIWHLLCFSYVPGAFSLCSPLSYATYLFWRGNHMAYDMSVIQER